MAVNKTRAKIEDVPAHDLPKWRKAQEKRERRRKRELAAKKEKGNE